MSFLGNLSSFQVSTYYLPTYTIILNTKLNSITFGYFQLRKTVFDYAQREIAPKAAEIDTTNTFNDLRVDYITYERIKYQSVN